MPEAPKLTWRRILLGWAARRLREMNGKARPAVPTVLRKLRRARGDFRGRSKR
jgi:hypothetical protein